MDTDGNIVLDMNCSLALGYNYDSLVNQRTTDKYDKFLQGKVDCTSVPPSDYADMLREIVMPIAPTGTNQVQLTDGRNSATNEQAISVALMRYAMTQKRDYKSLSVLGFEKNQHGYSFGTLSCADPIVNKNNVATYDWPLAPLPKLKYPLSRFEHENKAEEERCLNAVSELIKCKRADGKDIGAMIIEPITSLGNHQATPSYYKKLR